MNSTIQNVPTPHAHSLSGESGQGGTSGGMLLLNQKKEIQQDSQKTAHQFIEPIRFEKRTENDNSNRFTSLGYGYAKQLPIASRKMAPAIHLDMHKEYVDHLSTSLAKTTSVKSTFQPLPYAVAIAPAETHTSSEKTVERWQRQEHQPWGRQHPIIASRGLVQGVK
jgi:hypothetical protein